MSTSSVIVVDSSVPTAGAIVYWKLSGDTDHAALTAAWKAAGLDMELLPLMCSPVTALARAVAPLQQRRTKGQKRRIVSSLTEGGGWGVTGEHATNTTLRHDPTDLYCRLDVSGRVVCDPPDHVDAPRVRAAYAAALDQFPNEDMSSWVTTLIKHARAVSLKDGGFYFMPHDQLPTWQAWTAAIEGVSANRFHEIPSLQTEKAVAAILDAIISATEKEIALAQEKLDAGVGPVALATRRTELEAAENKLLYYSKFLGANVELMQQKLQAVQAHIGSAIMAARSGGKSPEALLAEL